MVSDFTFVSVACKLSIVEENKKVNMGITGHIGCLSKLAANYLTNAFYITNL